MKDTQKFRETRKGSVKLKYLLISRSFELLVSLEPPAGTQSRAVRKQLNTF